VAYLLLALRFLLELCLFAAWAVIGYSAFDNAALGVVAGIALTAVTATLWGVLLSPRRRTNLSLAARVAIELALFGAAGVALAALGHPVWAVILVAAELLVLGGLVLAGHRPGEEPGRPRS
jgi:hypothetical protein